MKLYQIGQQLSELELKLEETGGELPEEELDRYLNLSQAEGARIDDICRWIANLDSKAAYAEGQVAALKAMIGDEVARWEAARDADRKLADKLTQRLLVHFKTVRNGAPHEGDFKVKLNKVGGKRALIIPESWQKDPASAPEDFHRRKIELDKELIRKRVEEREHLLSGYVQDGVIEAQFKSIEAVTLAEQGVKLSIK